MPRPNKAGVGGVAANAFDVRACPTLTHFRHTYDAFVEADYASYADNPTQARVVCDPSLPMMRCMANMRWLMPCNS